MYDLFIYIFIYTFMYYYDIELQRVCQNMPTFKHYHLNLKFSIL